MLNADLLRDAMNWVPPDTSVIPLDVVRRAEFEGPHAYITPIHIPFKLASEITCEYFAVPSFEHIKVTMRLFDLWKTAVDNFRWNNLPLETRVILLKPIVQQRDYQKAFAMNYVPDINGIDDDDRWCFGYKMLDIESHLNFNWNDQKEEVHTLTAKLIPSSKDHYNLVHALEKKEVKMTLQGSFVKDFDTKIIEEISIDGIVIVPA